ncbi:hypothetical protein ABPG72_001366 [Tetrahymena utriculariae]
MNQDIDQEQNQLKNLYFRREESFCSEKSDKIFLDEVVEQINHPNQNISMIGEASNAISCSKNNFFQSDKENNSQYQEEIQVEISDLKNEIKSCFKKEFLERSSNPNIINTFSQKPQISNQNQNQKIMQYETWMSNDKTYCQNNQSSNQTKCLIIKQDINKITKIRQRILNFFLTKTISGRTNYLKISKVRNALNDYSDLRDQKRSRLINKLEIFMIQFQKQKKKCFKMIPLFNPQNPLLFSYQIIYNILNICFFTFLSVLLVFEGQFEYQSTTLKSITFIWALNVLIKLNTSIYIGTDIIIDREKIMANYFKKNALNDLLSFASLLLIQNSESINLYLAIISFIKIRNIKEENEDIQRQLCIAVKKYVSIQLINLVFKLFMIAHTIACIWQLVLVIERNYLNVVIESTSGIIPDNRQWWIIYLESLYWSLTLMATGSNLANTPLSITFTCLNMLITTIIFGYLINVIGVMLSAIDEQEQMQRRDINIINDYMRKRCISKNLQRRVNIDLEYFYQKNYKKISEENEQVLAKISTHLNDQIHKEYYGRILSKIQYISKYFSEQSLNKIIDCIEELYYLPNQIIFKEDQNSDFSLMYIAEGSVELSRQVSAESQISKTLAVLGQECIFGQHSFFTGHVRGACAKSKAFTTIIKISRDKFLNIIQQNEKDYEQFCQIKDDIMIYKNYEKIQVKCFICNKFNHYSSDCPLTHFDREEFYANMCFYQKIEQFRKQKERNKKKKTNTLLILHQVKDASNQMVQIEFKEYIEEVEKAKDYPITELETEDENESEFQSKVKSKEDFVSKQRNSIIVQSMDELQDIEEANKSQKQIQDGKSKLQTCGRDEFCQNQDRLENQRSSFNNILDSYQAQETKASILNKGSIKRIDQMDRDFSKDQDYVHEDIYSNYNKEQKNILSSSREDRMKLQNLNQRNEDTLQSEKVIQIQNQENPTNRYCHENLYSESNSQNITFSKSPRDQSKITAINIQQSDYQIVLGQLQDQQEADQKAEAPLLADQQQSSTQQSQFLKINLAVRRQGKRLSYVHGIIPRKESRMRSIIAMIQKHKNENKVDEIKLISKIKLRINQFFKQYTLKGKLDNLNNQMIKNFINDKCENFDCKNIPFYQTKLLYLSYQIQKLKCLDKIPLFNPQHPVCFFFQILFCLLNCIFFVFQCILIVFPTGIDDQIIYISLSIFWFIEFLIKINTSIYINTDLISKREQIIKLYLKNNALYDFLPILTIQLINLNKISSLIFKIITYVKLKNVMEDISDLQKQICMAIKKYYYVQLFNLISQVFIIGHSIACVWFLLAHYELEYLQNENWLSENEQIWWKLYIQSLFWALTLMTTGSNESKTVFEALFTSIIMLFICIIFCYLLDSIGNILADINEKERMMKKDINIINEFMRTHHISRNLQRSVNKDLENFYEKNYKKFKEENESVLQKISPHLKIQINKESYKKYIDKIAFITKNFSKETIEKLCQSIEEQYFTPNQILFNQNDNDSFCLMYIVDGQVELFRKSEQDQSIHQKIGILDKDSIIGQHSFLTGQQRMAGAKSKSFSTIIQISRDNFLKIVKENDEDFQKFCLIKDNIMIYKNYYNIGVCCSICKNYLHYSQDCPLAHLDRDQAYSKAKYLEKTQQRRSKYERKIVKFENSLAVQQKLYEIALLFQDIVAVSQEKLNEQKSYICSDQGSQNSEEENKSQSITEEYLNPSKKGSQLSNTLVEHEEDKKQKQTYSQVDIYSEQIKQKRQSIDYKNRPININVNEFYENKNKFSSKEDFEVKNTKYYLSPQIQEQDQNHEPKRSVLRDDHHKNIHFRDEQENLNRVKSFDRSPSELSTLKYIGSKQIQYQIEYSMHFADMRQNKQKKLTQKSILDQRKAFNSYLSHDNEENNSKEYYQSPWVFDKQKDYGIYFPDGNLAVVLFKHSKFSKKIQANKKLNRKSQRR